MTRATPAKALMALAVLTLSLSSHVTSVAGEDDVQDYFYDGWWPKGCDQKDLNEMMNQCECLDGTIDCNKKAPSQVKVADFCTACSDWSSYFHCGAVNDDPDESAHRFVECNFCQPKGDSQTEVQCAPENRFAKRLVGNQ